MTLHMKVGYLATEQNKTADQVKKDAEDALANLEQELTDLTEVYESSDNPERAERQINRVRDKITLLQSILYHQPI
jgi:hypothetical protein